LIREGDEPSTGPFKFRTVQLKLELNWILTASSSDMDVAVGGSGLLDIIFWFTMTQRGQRHDARD